MRINVSNSRLPGVQGETTLTLGSELIRKQIFNNGTYVGEVVYVRRQLQNGYSLYGWRPARNPRSALTDQVGAIKKLDLERING